MSLSAWWLNLIIQLFVGVVLEADIPLWCYWIMFVVAWFGSLGLAIASIASGLIETNTVICGVDMSLFTWVATLPYTLIYGTAIILLMPVLIKVTIMLIWVARGRAGREVINSKLRQNLRILVFAMYYLLVIGLVIGLFWWVYDKQDYLGEGYVEFLQCELTTMGEGECRNPTRIPYGYMAFFYFVVGIGAWVLFCAFGLGHTLIWVWWKTLLTTMKFPDSKEVERNATTTRTTPAIGSASGSRINSSKGSTS